MEVRMEVNEVADGAIVSITLKTYKEGDRMIQKAHLPFQTAMRGQY